MKQSENYPSLNCPTARQTPQHNHNSTVIIHIHLHPGLSPKPVSFYRNTLDKQALWLNDPYKYILLFVIDLYIFLISYYIYSGMHFLHTSFHSFLIFLFYINCILTNMETKMCVVYN